RQRAVAEDRYQVVHVLGAEPPNAATGDDPGAADDRAFDPGRRDDHAVEHDCEELVDVRRRVVAEQLRTGRLQGKTHGELARGVRRRVRALDLVAAEEGFLRGGQRLAFGRPFRARVRGGAVLAGRQRNEIEAAGLADELL